MPKVYNKRKGNIVPKNAVYVGRPTKYGNPFPSGKNRTRSESVQMFREFAEKKPAEWFEELKDKDLICWCAPLECHADVLIELTAEKCCERDWDTWADENCPEYPNDLSIIAELNKGKPY